MALKKLFLYIYEIMPPVLKKKLYSIHSIGMKLLCPIIVFKMNRGKFLNREIKNINNISNAIEFAFSFQYLTFSIKVGQVKYEITKLLEILKDLKPKIILEIGTAGGGTLYLFTRIIDPEATIISVDLPGGTFGGGYSEWKIPLYQSFTKNGQKIKLLRADSHNPKTFKLVKTILADKKVDFLFIDGDHTYEGVKRDFNMYSSLVKEGGIIAFHDIVEHDPRSSCKVNKFWNEIKNDHEYLEIIKDRKQKWAGIGVIYL
jgi:predicted O-methyltransferase YrrM